MRGREFIDEGRLLVRPRRRRGADAATTGMCDGLRAHLRPLRPGVIARSRPTPARSAAIASQEFQVIAETGEDAIVYCPRATTPPTSRWPRRCAPSRPAPGADASAREDADARQEHLRGRRRAARRAARATVKSLVLATDAADDAATSRAADLAAAGARRPRRSTRSRPARCPGLKRGFRFATVAEIESHFGCKPGYLGPIGARQPVQARRRSRGRGDERLHLRRERGRLPLHRRQLGPRPARARPRRRHPQRRRRRSVARRQGRARHPARHRGRPRLLARHEVQPER